MPEVKIIPPVSQHAERLRVAAYARVSSDSADQLNSFASQIAYYTDVIQSEEDWEFAGPVSYTHLTLPTKLEV